jgi:hypothetical protein
LLNEHSFSIIEASESTVLEPEKYCLEPGETPEKVVFGTGGKTKVVINAD